MAVLLAVLDKEESIVWFSDGFQVSQVKTLLFINYIFGQLHLKVLLPL